MTAVALRERSSGVESLVTGPGAAGISRRQQTSRPAPGRLREGRLALHR